MHEDGSEDPRGFSKGKGKGKPPPPPLKEDAKGPPKAATSALALKVRTADGSCGYTARQQGLHLTSGRELLSLQEKDGHFSANSLALKLDRLWRKLMILEVPSDPRSDLADDIIDATVFIVILFERFVEKLCAQADDDEGLPQHVDQVRSWFGNSSCLGDAWLESAITWLNDQRANWREARLPSVEKMVGRWFAMTQACKLKEICVDLEHFQQMQNASAQKSAASHLESLHREKLWEENQPLADLCNISWEEATDVRWCFGGGGGCYLVRLDSHKFIVKGCQDEGDVIAHELARIMDVRVPNLRFVCPSSSEFDGAHVALTSARADEPEHGRGLAVMFTRLKKTGCPLMIMEFVHGDSLPSRQGSEALTKAEELFMTDLGRMVVLDVLMNNWDRLPALTSWPSAGNLGNVLIATDDRPVAIDQAVKQLCEPQKRMDYYRMLRTFVEEASSSNPEFNEFTTRTKAAIHDQVMIWTGDAEKDAACYQHVLMNSGGAHGVVLSDTACGHLMGGVRHALNKAASLQSEFTSRKPKIKDECATFFVMVDGEHHVERIDACLTFVEDCLGVVSSEELFKAVLETTSQSGIIVPSRKFFSTLQCSPEAPVLGRAHCDE